MKRISKTLQPGVHILAIPTSEEISIESLFPKEISGSSIEKLDSNGKWEKKEKILYQNNAFTVSKFYKTLSSFDTIRLTLKRQIVLEWSLAFQSSSGLKKHSIIHQNGLHYDKALHLLELCQLVYKDEKSIKYIIEDEKRYIYENFYFYSKTSHKGFFKRSALRLLWAYFRSKKMIVDLQFMHLDELDEESTKEVKIIVFRGSSQLKDWMTNLTLQETDFLKKGNVHKGFYSGVKLFFKTMKKQDSILSRKLKYTNKTHGKNTKIILAGHSLGGALATLAGCLLIEHGFDKDDIEVYSYGAPPVGDERFCDYFKDRLNLFRFINENDKIDLVNNVTKFSYFGKEIVLPSNENEVHQCDDYIDNLIDLINSRK